MKKQIILHIGFAKTASTTIQNTLGRNRAALEKKGLSFARFSLADKDLPNHGLAFGYLFSDEPARHIVHVTRGLDLETERLRHRAEFEAALEGHDTVMFSAEGVSMYRRGELEKVRDAFVLRGYDVRVVAFVRPAVSFLTSFAQQNVKIGSPLSVPYEKLPSIAIRRIESVFPDAEFYSFDAARNHPAGPTNFLLEKLGFPAKLKEVAQSNLGWSDNAVRLAGFINRFAPTVNRGRLNRLRKHADIRSISRIGGPRFTLTAGEVDQEVLKKEIRWLERRFDESFHEDLNALPEQPAEWAPEQIDEAMQFIRDLPVALVPLASAYFQIEARLKDVQGMAQIAKMVDRRLFRRLAATEEAATEKTTA